MRLIDADGLKGKAFADPDDGEHFVYCQDIDEAQTVDAVPVGRCRYCASFEEIGKYPTNKGGTPFGYCYHWPYEQGMPPNEVDGNDFCSHWEKKRMKDGRT